MLACNLDTFGVDDPSSAGPKASSSDLPTGGTDSASSTNSTTESSASSSHTTSTSSATSTTSSAAPSTGANGICGDGVTDQGEACDDGDPDNENECTNTCLVNPCGNLILDDGEMCDDGRRDGGDRCSPTCTIVEIDDISVGMDHTCALFKSGSVRCWGQNEFGALCNGTTEDLGDQPGELPVPDISIADPVKKLASGAFHSCAILMTGNVVCWGKGGAGQLGYGPTEVDANCDTKDEVPPQQIDLGASAEDIALGGVHSCAIVTDRTVRCWGFAASGQLGTDDQVSRYFPAVVKGITGAHKLAAGGQHTCVLLDDASVQCWGGNLYGQLGIGNAINLGGNAGSMPPPAVLGLGGPAVAIATGGYHSCAIVQGGDVRCWGYNDFGQLGTGTSGPGTQVGDQPGEPLISVDLGAPAVELALGYYHSCALLSDGGVKCWGRGAAGSLGYAKTDNIDLPGEFTVLNTVELGDSAFKLRSVGGYDPSSPGQTTCALLMDMTLRCWGNNEFGQLGLGHRLTIGDDETPDDPALAGPVPY